jgi:hypothetical protein
MYCYYNGALYHSGVRGQKWGVRNAAWYPIDAYKRHLKRTGEIDLGLTSQASTDETKVGSAIGGVAGGLVGSMLPLPGASVAGTVIGSALGGAAIVAASNFIAKRKALKAETLVKEANSNSETKNYVKEIEKRYSNDNTDKITKDQRTDIEEYLTEVGLDSKDATHEDRVLSAREYLRDHSLLSNEQINKEAERITSEYEDNLAEINSNTHLGIAGQSWGTKKKETIATSEQEYQKELGKISDELTDLSFKNPSEDQITETVNKALNLFNKKKETTATSEQIKNNQNDTSKDKQSSETNNSVESSTEKLAKSTDDAERKRVLSTGTAAEILANQSKYQYTSQELNEAYNRITNTAKLSDLAQKDTSSAQKYAKQISDALGPITLSTKAISNAINNSVELYNNVKKVKGIVDALNGKKPAEQPKTDDQKKDDKKQQSKPQTTTLSTKLTDIGSVNIVDITRQLKELDKKKQGGNKK